MSTSAQVIVRECTGGGPLDGDRLHVRPGVCAVSVMQERQTGRCSAVAHGATPNIALYRLLGWYCFDGRPDLVWEAAE